MIYGVFGKPRSGKSTFLAMYVAKALRARQLAQLPIIGKLWKRNKYYYDVIFSTAPMMGTVLIRPFDIGYFEPRSDMRSLFVIHEAGISFNNRNHKDIPDYCTDFFAEHGHYNCDIIYDSQSVDIDKKLRNRTQNFYVITKCPLRRWRSKVIKVKYWIGVNKQAQKLDECYTEPTGLLESIFARVTRQTYTFRRRPYYWLFDSYSRDLRFAQPAPEDVPDSPYPMWRAVFHAVKCIALAALFVGALIYCLCSLL